MSKHTPGPWYALTGDNGGIVDQATVFSEHETDGEPTFIAETMGVDEEVPLEQRKANARLIAVSPKLLAALELIRDSGPIAAGNAKQMSFKDWAKMIAQGALTQGERG